MKCSNCQADIVEGAKFCVKCGHPVASDDVSSHKRTLRIYGYKEWYAITPKVDVYMNGEKIASLARNGSMEIELGNDNTYFEFIWNQGLGFVRKCHCFVNKTFNGGLQLYTSRITGAINVKYTL